MSHSSPLEVVQAQLDAYNAKDIDALLATYSPNAAQYATGGELLAKGHEQMRPRFLARFAEPNFTPGCCLVRWQATWSLTLS